MKDFVYFVLLILFFAIVLLLPSIADAKVYNILGRKGSHIGACAYHITPKGLFIFKYCSEDNSIPGKDPIKSFTVTTSGKKIKIITDNKITFMNMHSGKTSSLVFSSHKSVKTRNRYVLNEYTVNSPKLYQKLFMLRIPIAIIIMIENQKHMFVLSKEEIDELEIISKL